MTRGPQYVVASTEPARVGRYGRDVETMSTGLDGGY
jgi:hypothetical protein